MDKKKNGIDKAIRDAMPPGFRFHPSDEELVGFYLKRKVQQRPFPFELIKQADIYKYDPWDLPKLGGMGEGEKEWFFYCPRDRKYPNSMRPNRATGTGFWKATGTDRPIYSSHTNKCIGLKKSLVFYKGRAARGIKTDWMMYEFRLPSLLSGLALPPKKPLDKSLPLNDSWTICKIFNKANPKAQRAISLSDELSQFRSPEDIYCTTESIPPPISAAVFSAALDTDFPSHCKPIYPTTPCTHHRPTFQLTLPNGELPGGDPGGVCNLFSPPELFNGLSDEDVRAIPFRADLEGPRQQFYGNSSIGLLQQMMQGNMGSAEEDLRKHNNPGANPSISDYNHWENVGLVGLPVGLPSINQPSLPWDSSPSLGVDFQ